jgi:HAD superfamily hydrolase (TIGR01549 family)
VTGETRIEAVLCDVDGTLYHQPTLRVWMAAELAGSLLSSSPGRAARRLRILRAFRDERERLRAIGRPTASLEIVQYSRAADIAGVPSAEVRAVVEEWIYRKPLKYLERTARRGCRETLLAFAARGLKVGVFSDYPTAEKVEALGLTSVLSLQLCATDAAINAFKPHPAGFLEACHHWGLSPDRVVYVGDRAEVDAVGARGAGMHAIVIGRRSGDGYTGVPSFRALTDAVTGDAS